MKRMRVVAQPKTAQMDDDAKELMAEIGQMYQSAMKLTPQDHPDRTEIRKYAMAAMKEVEDVVTGWHGSTGTFRNAFALAKKAVEIATEDYGQLYNQALYEDWYDFEGAFPSGDSGMDDLEEPIQNPILSQMQPRRAYPIPKQVVCPSQTY